MKKVSVLIPGYNEAENIEHLVKEIDEFIEKFDIKDWEFIYIDDGSTDSTLEEINKYLKERNYLKLVSYKRNMGKTYALQRGLKVAEGDIIVIFDADLQFTLNDAKRLVEKIEEGFDIVCGKKTGKYNKRVVSFFYNTLTRLLFKVPASDMNSIKAIRKEVLLEVPLRKDWHRYIVVWGWEYGFSVTEINVELRPRRFGVSKYRGFKRVLIGFLDLVAVKIQISFMRKPMLLFGTLSIISFLIGLIGSLIGLYIKFFIHKKVRLISIVFLIALFSILSLLFFLVGFLGEAIAGIHDRLDKLEKRR
ncbi:MAG: glycosyltransferase family 2 protein [Candidatus Hydrothermales bacterium]